MAKVYLVNEAGHDFTPARQFGELVPITSGNINISRPDRDLFYIKKILADFDPKEDFILPSGNVLANIMVTSVLTLEYKVKSIKLLIYNAKLHAYLQHEISYANKELKFLRQENENSTHI